MAIQKRRAFGCLLLAAWLFPSLGQAQSGSTTGDVKGAVQDASRAVIAGATLTLTNPHTGFTRTATTDERGEYRMAAIPPGSYELKAEMPGFSTKILRPVVVTVGTYAVADFELAVATREEVVEVTGAGPVVEVLRTQQAATITQRSINDLPINGRNFLNFALLTPGVVEANPNVPLLKQLPSTGLSFGGQNGRLNQVTIDGADNTDAASNSVRATPSQEAVEEYQVNSNSYLAEFGRAGSGVINIVTKSGTNEWHGNVFLFHRNQSIQARNFFAGEKPKFHRNQPGFTVGGPLVQDRTFVFAAYEALLQREPTFVNLLRDLSIFRPTGAQAPLFEFLKKVPVAALQNVGLNPALAVAFDIGPTSPIPANRNAFGLLSSLNGAKPFKLTRNVGNVKFDHSFSPNSHLALTHIWSHEKSFGNFVGGLTTLTRGTFNTLQDNTFTASHAQVISPRTLNEAQFQFARRVFNVDTIDRFGPAISIQGVADLGRDFNLDSDRIERRLQWSDKLTATRGAHKLKFGADVNYIWYDTRTPIFLGGSFDFQSLGPAFPLGGAMELFKLLVPAGSPLASLSAPQRLGALLTATGQAALIPTVLGGPALAPLTSLQMFVLGLPVVYNQGFGNPLDSFSNKQLGFFAQDSVALGRRLNLNFGLRYDVELQPEPLNRDTNNVGPRFGFSYSPFASNRTVIRGGYGIMFAPLYNAVAFASRVLDGEKIVNVVRDIRSDLTQTGVGSATIWGFLNQAGILGNRTITAADLARFGIRPGGNQRVVQGVTSNVVNPYTHQASFGIERQLGSDISVEVDYNLVRGVKAIRNKLTNLRATGERVIVVGGQTLDFGPTFAPIDPTLLAKFVIGTEASSIYHGMTARVTKRFRHHSSLLGSYTWGKVIDDSTDINQSLGPQNPLNARAERGLSAFDVRHRLVVSAVLESPFENRILRDFTLSPISTYRTGYPFNLLLGVDPDTGNFNAVNTQRPAFAGRNTGRGPDFYSFDLRVARRFRLDGEGRRSLDWIMEGFNLFNRTNFKSVNNIVGSLVFPFPTFRVSGTSRRRPTEFLGFTQAFDPRQFQLAVKINW